jgi:hypothetical protein
MNKEERQLSHFDTYIFIKNLESSGIPEHQAKAICDGLKECHEASDHVSKADLMEFKSEMKTEMSDFKTEIKTEMSDFKAEIKTEMADFKSEIRSDMAEFKADIKADMSEFKVSMKADMDCLESRLDKKISDTAHRQTKVIGAMVVGSITLLSLFDRYLPTNIASVAQNIWS